ncbi:MAG: hypothetical protein ACKPKO_36295, partial [Candidatus Fonsibacter sp.]
MSKVSVFFSFFSVIFLRRLRYVFHLRSASRDLIKNQKTKTMLNPMYHMSSVLLEEERIQIENAKKN